MKNIVDGASDNFLVTNLRGIIMITNIYSIDGLSITLKFNSIDGLSITLKFNSTTIFINKNLQISNKKFSSVIPSVIITLKMAL